MDKKKNKKIKNNQKLIEKQFKGEDTEASKLIKIAIIVIVSFAVIYFATAILTGEIKFGEEQKEVTIQYEEILAEQTFKQNDSTYYVLYYNFDDEKASVLNAINSKLSQNNTTYKVDLGNVSNKNYLVDEKTNIKTNITKVSDLKVKNPTLIKISKKKIVKFVTGLNNIQKFATSIK